MAATDPVDRHILLELAKLREQNLRLREYVEKSGAWAEMKNVDKWAPFDFLHYFCNLYQKKYRTHYRVPGNVVTNYQRIEAFMFVNKISKKDYKEFIDLAFARHFNACIKPVIANIVNEKLYNKVMRSNVRQVRTKDWFEVDQAIAREGENLEALMNADDLYTQLDNRIASESLAQSCG